jgi:hypothetical protein
MRRSAATLVLVLAATCRAWGADNTPPCLTHEQARAAYPRQWLYWHGPKHCWNNQGRAPSAQRKPLTAEQIDEIQYREEAERRLATCCWPTLPTIPFLPWELRINDANGNHQPRLDRHD